MIADTSSPMHTGWTIFADDIADDITFGWLTFWSLFYSFWCRFRAWRTFRRTSIIRRIRRRLICFSSNLHVTGFSSCRITIMIHSCLVCVCMCVYHLYRCKTSWCGRGVWHSCPTTRNEAVDMSGMGNVAGFQYLLLFSLYVYIYI